MEFKGNNIDPTVVGVRISALANSARLADKHTAYLVWGIEDGSHEVVGTDFVVSTHQVQKQPFEFWLAQRLQPAPVLEFHDLVVNNRRVVLL